MNCNIWSNEHRGWWGPNQWGYTPDRTKAGIYSIHQANEICRKANEFLLTDEPPNEIAVPILDGNNGHATLMRELTDARSRVASLEAFIAGSKESTAVQQAVIIQGMLGFDASVRPEQVYAAVTELLEGRKRDRDQVELLLRLRDEAQALVKTWQDECEKLRVAKIHVTKLRAALAMLDYDADGIPTSYPTRAYRDELLGLKVIVAAVAESAAAPVEPLILEGQGDAFVQSGAPSWARNAHDAVLGREGRLNVVRPGSHRHRVLAAFKAFPDGLRQIDAGQIALEQYSVGANTEAGPNTGRRRCTDLAALGLIAPVADYDKSARWGITTDGIAALKLLDAGEAWRVNNTPHRSGGAEGNHE